VSTRYPQRRRFATSVRSAAGTRTKAIHLGLTEANLRLVDVPRLTSAVPFPGDAPAPPVDDPDGDGDGPSDHALDDLLPPLDDEPTNEDIDAEELVTVPSGLEAPSDPGGIDDALPPDLDVGPTFDFGEEEEDAADVFGLVEPGTGKDQDLGEDALPEGEERDGLDDAPVGIEERDLPELDADDGVDGAVPTFGSLTTVDEAPLPRSAIPWVLTTLGTPRERCGALAVGGGVIVAGSSDLLWLDAGRSAPVRIALDGTRIASIALVGEDRQVALCVTAFGRLLRRARQSSDAERLNDWKRAAELGGGAESLELCQLDGEPNAVLGRLTSGRLIRSDDLGTSFTSLAEGLTVFALSPSGAPLAALARDGTELVLSADGGRSFTRSALPPLAQEIAGGDAPMLASAGPLLVIADGARGAVVSSDGGRTFHRVNGCAGATAVAVGTCQGRPTAWVTLYSETVDRTELALVDVERATAEVVAVLVGEPAEDAADAAGTGRLERLAWDGRRLLAVGDPGLVSFEPPAG
jgi:hypothetical protein